MTTAVLLVQRLHQHRNWVNGNLILAAEGLSEEALEREFAIGQGSVWKSLVHLYAGEFVWLEALLGNDDPVVQGDVRGKIPGNQLGDGGFRSLVELREKWRLLQERWEKYLAELKPETLEEAVYKVAFSTGRRVATKRFDVLLHVCTHAQYTTAQIVNMLRHVGVQKLPETMLITLARQEGAV
jgi:uncharacterized damage-inducible protein DinB